MDVALFYCCNWSKDQPLEGCKVRIATKQWLQQYTAAQRYSREKIHNICLKKRLGIWNLRKSTCHPTLPERFSHGSQRGDWLILRRTPSRAQRLTPLVTVSTFFGSEHSFKSVTFSNRLATIFTLGLPIIYISQQVDSEN